MDTSLVAVKSYRKCRKYGLALQNVREDNNRRAGRVHGFRLLLVLRLQFHGPSSLLLCILHKFPCLLWLLPCLAEPQRWINRISLPCNWTSLEKNTQSRCLVSLYIHDRKPQWVLEVVSPLNYPSPVPPLPYSSRGTLSHLLCFASLFSFSGINTYFTEKIEAIRRQCLKAHILFTSLPTPASIHSAFSLVPI